MLCGGMMALAMWMIHLWSVSSHLISCQGVSGDPEPVPGSSNQTASKRKLSLDKMEVLLMVVIHFWDFCHLGFQGNATLFSARMQLGCALDLLLLPGFPSGSSSSRQECLYWLAYHLCPFLVGRDKATYPDFIVGTYLI